jgi:hypothetical protein
MAICRRVRDRVLVAVPLIAHTLAFERLILGRRNFQFLVSKVAPDPVPKHLDILLRRCSNSSLRTHGSFQVRTALLDCSGKVMINCCPKSRRNDAQSVHREWLPHAFPRASTRHTSVNIDAYSDEAGRLYRLKPAGDSDDPGHLVRRALVSTLSSGQLAGSSSSL